MVERGFGCIVNLVHIYSCERGAPPFAHSGTARAGVVNMTRSLAYDWAPHGVTVNALARRFVATAGLREEVIRQDDYDTLAARDIPAQRLAESDEVAAVVLVLCSPGARYINDATIVADGRCIWATGRPGGIRIRRR